MNQLYSSALFALITIESLLFASNLYSGGKKNIKIVPTQKARVQDLKRNKTTQKRPIIKPLSSKRKIYPAVKTTKQQSIPVPVKQATESIATQTETADPTILLALTGILQEEGDALFNYVEAIYTYKKDLSLRLSLDTIAREGYIALNSQITDAATLETIQQTGDLDRIIKETSQKAHEFVLELQDLMLERLTSQDKTKKTELKKIIDTTAHKLTEEQEAARKKEVESEVTEIIATIDSMQKIIKKQQQELESQIKQLNKVALQE